MGDRGTSALRRFWPPAVSLAVLGSTLLPQLPPRPIPFLLLLLGLALLARSTLRLPALAFLVIGACLLAYQARLDDRLPASMTGQVVTVEGRVASIPQAYNGRTRFRFATDRETAPAGTADELLLNWYRDAPHLALGQHWRLELRLKPPWSAVNFAGSDRERWYFAQGITATGTVRGGELLGLPVVPARQAVRRAVLDGIERLVDAPRERAVIRALAAADRSRLAAADRRLLTVTGTAHLLAISGLHVGLAALGGLLAGRLLLWPLAPWLRGRLGLFLVLLCGVLSAAAYAVLADLGVSTVRALLMTVAAAVVLGSARAVSPLRAYFVALAMVLLLDPFAPLGSGFWFSFLAVGALLAVFAPRTGRPAWWRAPLAAQAAVFLVLLPCNVAWFSGFSPAAFPANLLAIPWVSFLVVPPVLLGVAGLLLPDPVAAALWTLASHGISLLFRYLEILAGMQPFLVSLKSVPAWQLAAATAGGLLLLLPRPMGLRRYAPFLILPLFLPAPRPGAEALRIDVLDVGQGTAVTVTTRSSSLLYDTGPGDGDRASFLEPVILPALADTGAVPPERVVISHGDLDHTGGLAALSRRFPGVAVLGSAQRNPRVTQRCMQGESWRRDGVAFRVLHPGGSLPYLRNNSSCVLSVRSAAGSLLLAGDVDAVVENRLVLDGIAPHGLLLVPHHGSKSSSSAAFLEAVDPAVAIASAGIGNRFGFPHESVARRFAERGIPLWTTAGCGGLRLEIDPGGRIVAGSARKQRARIWRWPAETLCP